RLRPRVAEGDVRAARRELARDDDPDPLAAGDQRDLVRQIHPSLLSRRSMRFDRAERFFHPSRLAARFSSLALGPHPQRSPHADTSSRLRTGAAPRYGRRSTTLAAARSALPAPPALPS